MGSEGLLVADMWADVEQRLVKDPQAVLKGRGITPAEGVEFRVVENGEEVSEASRHTDGTPSILVAARHAPTGDRLQSVWSRLRPSTLHGKLIQTCLVVEGRGRRTDDKRVWRITGFLIQD